MRVPVYEWKVCGLAGYGISLLRYLQDSPATPAAVPLYKAAAVPAEISEALPFVFFVNPVLIHIKVRLDHSLRTDYASNVK